MVQFPGVDDTYIQPWEVVIVYQNQQQHSNPLPATKSDIILGRGRGKVDHPGNVVFYKQIDVHLAEYAAMQMRSEKSAVVQSTYEYFSQNDNQFFFYERTLCSFKNAKQGSKSSKTSHATRYKLRKQRVWSNGSVSSSQLPLKSFGNEKPRMVEKVVHEASGTGTRLFGSILIFRINLVLYFHKKPQFKISLAYRQTYGLSLWFVCSRATL